MSEWIWIGDDLKVGIRFSANGRVNPPGYMWCFFFSDAAVEILTVHP